MTRRQVLLESISALLILLFLYASISKFLDFEHFRREMNNQPFPNEYTPFLIWFIPLTEIAIAILLIKENARIFGLIAALILMLAFTIYSIVILLHYFKYVPCSCGGVIRNLTWKQHLLFNLFFVALAAIGIVLQRTKFSKSIIITKNSFV